MPRRALPDRRVALYRLAFGVLCPALLAFILRAMSFWLRITLTWLLALALPLQGHAAQTMLMCGSSYGAPVGLAFLVQPSDDTDAHAHPQASDTSAGHGIHAAPDPSTADASNADPAPQTSHGKCSVCAACCGAFALTSAVLVFEASTAPALYRNEAQMPRLGTIPVGLERPPRNPLA